MDNGAGAPGAQPSAARHYLDHASSSPPRPEVGHAVEEWLRGGGADPGRVHEEGQRVRALVERARDQVALLLGVRPRQVVFTSGATEAANAAVFSATRAQPDAPIVCSAVEHSSVRRSSSRAAPVTPVPVGHTGRIEPEAVLDALRALENDRPALVHCQWANHEVGTLQPVAEVVALCREREVPVHVDAAAACGQLALDLGALGADLVSLSPHTFGGPPGVGALIVRRGLRVQPLLVGGAQERDRRAGMENVPGILGFGAVAERLAAEGGEALCAEEREARHRTERITAAALAVPDVTVVGDPDPAGRLPNLVCLGVHGVEAEPIVIGLDRRGLAVHSGSACSSEAWEPSPVLEAMGVDPNHSLRPSVGWSSTDEDVEAFSEAFADVVTALRGLRA